MQEQSETLEKDFWRWSILYECMPKSLISARSKVTEREYTDEQKQAMADRLRDARSKNM